MRDIGDDRRNSMETDAKLELHLHAPLSRQGPPVMSVVLVWIIVFWSVLFGVYALVRGV